MFVLTGQDLSTQHSVIQFCFMNLNIRTANMTFSGMQVILHSRSQSSGIFCSIRIEIGASLVFQCIYAFAFSCISLQLSVCFKRFAC